MTETNKTKFQAWRTDAVPGGLSIQGTVRVILWSAMKDFSTGKAGSVTVFLRHFTAGGYTEIARGSLRQSDWQGGVGTWLPKTITLTGVNYSVPVNPPGSKLEVLVVVNSDSDDDMWFAYDTTTYRSLLILP